MARNARHRGRTELALGGSRVVGALVAGAVLGAAMFALGLELKRDDAPAEPEPLQRRLDLLDEVERIAPPAQQQISYGYHRRVTGDPAKDSFPAVPKPHPAPARRPSEVHPAPAPALAARGPGTVATLPAPAPAAAAPIAPRPAAGGWAIQLGASPDEAEARRLAAKHPGAQVASADVDGKRWFRVRLAGFANRAEAQHELERLQGAGGPRGFVTAAR